MTMNNMHKGKIISFWELIDSYKIEIPIIQRDYAQGRKDKKELRGNFLRALSDSLRIGNDIKLDFIYGDKSVGKENEEVIFNPLDGQQRLTTLFLLHWYAMQKENMGSIENKEKLKRFSYETRASSRDFCRSLVENKIDFNKDDKISNTIIDSHWFFLAWQKDPTITSMLRTIDDIHLHFNNINNIWDKLTKESSLISFYHVELQDIGLTDDLYIKMNSRGKLLTYFENFKALFQKQINENGWDKGRGVTETFSHKIDSVWTDLFWHFRKDNRIDNSFMRLISTIAMYQQVTERLDNRIETISYLHKGADYARVEHFSRVGYQFLYEILDLYNKVIHKNINLNTSIPFWEIQPEDTFFSAIVKEDDNASYTQKVLFYAQTLYLKSVEEFEDNSFAIWMRVVRNIVSRGNAERNGKRATIIRSPETFEGVINLINELSAGCKDIYTYLLNNPIKSSFARDQIKEETLKAFLIQKNEEYKRAIYNVEDTEFFRGRIEFAFYCINYFNKEDDFDLDLFSKLSYVFSIYIEKGITDSFRRALLTIHDDDYNYTFYNYWRSWSYIVEANKRCLIAKYRELEYIIYGNYKDNSIYKNYIKKLIILLTEKSLSEIIADFTAPDGMPHWKVKLIKEKSLLSSCKSKYIAIKEDDSTCFMLRSVRPRSIEGYTEIK